jgi:competence protein ComEA
VAGGAVAGGLINVNTASTTELEELPGVGEVIAQAIVDHRTENGPFTSVDQLLDVSGIGDATLESIRELVTV